MPQTFSPWIHVLKNPNLKFKGLFTCKTLQITYQDAFTDLKSVSKSHNPAVNVPERVEIPIKVTQLPNQNKRGRSTVTMDKAPKRAPRKKRNINSKGVNANQHQVDGHQDVQLIHQMPSTNVHINNSTGTLEDPDSIIVGNNEESQRVIEISTNFIDSGE